MLELEHQINNLKIQISNLPNGKLICSHNGTRCKWYHSDGHIKTYIPKGNRKLAEDLALKKYYTCLLEDLEAEKKLYHLSLCSSKRKSEQLLLNDSELQNLLKSHFTPLSQELNDWMQSPFNSNPNHQEHLIHSSISGHMLRSKSECMIDMLLFQKKIPFRYECELNLNNNTLYPDFTIRHPKTGKLYYWEHFGMMDDPKYVKKTMFKLNLYTTNQIIPSIHLITTYETKEHPLCLNQIETIISHYFL